VACQAQLWKEAMPKKSLEFIRRIGVPRSGAEYVCLLKPSQRSVIARYRLGAWLWLCRKDDLGNRICQLCGEIENGFHAFIDCKINGKGKQFIERIFTENNVVELNILAEELRSFF